MQPVQKLHPLDVPFDADRIDSPIVSYGSGPTCINLLVEDGSWCRVTFEKLDALRVCRGERDPYHVDRTMGDPYRWVHTVLNSHWLRERYDYEKRHYGDCYEFNGDVNEMLRDFSHFVFSFHDEFVEAIAAGIWFEGSPDCLDARPLTPGHPLLDLPPDTCDGYIEANGSRYLIRKNSKTLDQLKADASFCSQKLIQLASAAGDSTSVDWTVTLRRPKGGLRSDLCGCFGTPVRSFDGVATLSDVISWLREKQD